MRSISIKIAEIFWHQIFWHRALTPAHAPSQNRKSHRVMKHIHGWVVLALLSFVGCGSPTQSSQPEGSPTIDPLMSQPRSLGWLDAQSHPNLKNLSIADPDDSYTQLSPGGVVLCELGSQSPLAKAGLQPKDTIVRVAEEWLPNKEDTTLDFLNLIESQLTDSETEIPLTFLRDGAIQTTALAINRKSLNLGLPLNISRLQQAGQTSLAYLQSLQSEDGSFFSPSAADDLTSRLRISAVAGLALLAGGGLDPQNEAHSAWERCGTYLREQIAVARKSKSSFDPLTSAYLLMFITESKFDLTKKPWRTHTSFLKRGLQKTQSESGGWMPSDSSDTAIDIQGTFVTNQVLLALGMLERHGKENRDEVIQAACTYLRQQESARKQDNLMDRRIKAALSAGTGVALQAINCHSHDEFLLELASDNQTLAKEILFSPTASLTGLVSSAVFSRQLGNDTWVNYYNQVKTQLVCLQQPDGQITRYAGSEREPLSCLVACDSPAWRTACGCLIFFLQTENLPYLATLTTSSELAMRDSLGNRGAGGGMPGGMPPGATMITGEDLGLTGDETPEEMAEKIAEALGIDPEDIQMGPPPEGMEGLPIDQ